MKQFALCCFFILFLYTIQGQTKLSPNCQLILFTDKNNSTFDTLRPHEFLSQRAINRRLRQNIKFQTTDIPVCKAYTDSLTRMGFEIVNVSKWLNAVCVKNPSSELLLQLKKISFVSKINLSSSNLKSVTTSSHISKKEKITTPVNQSQLFGASYAQAAIHNGHFLHQRGFRGENILVAVLDAGFNNINKMKTFDSLRNDNRIVLTRDIANIGGNVYLEDSHGTSVLSTISANVPNTMVGTSPKASVALIRTEIEDSENLIEEFNWVVGAELADSIGADIINSSLGYSLFDDPSMNHTYTDMNGNITMISKAANTATSKGMIVVVSAGNEGNKEWKYITAPSDADNVLTVGAIDKNGRTASFSSVGPTSDTRTKPDIVAVGVNTLVANPSDSYGFSNGTSFSAPVISGLVACLWQAFPNKSNIEIIDAIKKSASSYKSPNNTQGYGIPDFEYSFHLLTVGVRNSNLVTSTLKIHPNPFSNQTNIQLSSIGNKHATLSVFEINGKEVFTKQIQFIDSKYVLDGMSDLPKGIYFLKIVSDKKVFESKLCKL